MKTEFSAEPATLAYMPLPDGKADVWLRQNITQETRETENGTETVWTADEVYFRTSLSQEEIEENFDAIFENGGPVVDEDTGEELTDGVTLKERVEVLEESQLEMAALMAELLG